MSLQAMAIGLGAVIAALHAACLAGPERMRAVLKRFPRSRAAAWALTAVDLLWAGYLLYWTPLGPVEHLKPLLYVLVPLSIFLVGRFVDDLLAPRALGGLLLLIPAPLLAAARWHDTPLRFAVIVPAYVAVAVGILLVLSPYQFRKAVQRFLPTNRACRAAGAIGLVAGVALIAIAIVAY